MELTKQITKGTNYIFSHQIADDLKTGMQKKTITIIKFSRSPVKSR